MILHQTFLSTWGFHPQVKPPSEKFFEKPVVKPLLA